MALLLGATPEELMAELFGRANGNAKGRGGSMHLYTERMLGGFAIVGGHLPIAAGAAYSLKYRKKKEECVLCFLGEGAVAQGAFHESLNLASLWSLPVVYVIENNQWGMGTHVSSALCVSKNIAETLAPAYNMKGYTVDGMDYFSCYRTFTEIKKEREKTDRPILVECVCERLRGHSISDPGLYRTKESLQEITQRDPILLVKKALEADGLSAEEYKEWDKTCKERVIQALAFAQSSPWPSVDTLEKEVYAP
jgi:pyruvate dehydrogenase E1 component alpha subunit